MSSRLGAFRNWLERGVRYRRNRECGDESLIKGREPLQMGWYAHAASLVRGERVIDVGCGIGDGLLLLSESADGAIGIDLDERLARRTDVTIEVRDLATVPDGAFDTVVCIDVIEHVEDDAAFVADLARVARKRIYVSTPNYAVSLNSWPYHVREYTPRELQRLLAPHGQLTSFGGTATGAEREQIRRIGLYNLICDLYCYRGTNWVAKVLRRIVRVRVWAHQAIVVERPPRA
jgi:SAM-dependent methyltransferase